MWDDRVMAHYAFRLGSQESTYNPWLSGLTDSSAAYGQSKFGKRSSPSLANPYVPKQQAVLGRIM